MPKALGKSAVTQQETQLAASLLDKLSMDHLNQQSSKQIQPEPQYRESNVGDDKPKPVARINQSFVMYFIAWLYLVCGVSQAKC
ncbi:hypothetical protein PCASD_01981 [Puccinia coronata f. sp. avenae]|nr:hypothetical protein PCASD_01981 [Puccinia coronata f. sp. avenae]